MNTWPLESGRPRRFEFRNRTSAKFWQVEVTPGVALMVVRFGRIGTQGQSYQTACATYRGALGLAESKINEKLNKGYVEVETGPSKVQSYNAASTASGVAKGVDFEDVYVGQLSDKQIVDLASKLTKRERDPKPGLAQAMRCACGTLLVSEGERNARKCATCLSLALALGGIESGTNESKAKPDLLAPVRKIRFTE